MQRAFSGVRETIQSGTSLTSLISPQAWQTVAAVMQAVLIVPPDELSTSRRLCQQRRSVSDN